MLAIRDFGTCSMSIPPEALAITLTWPWSRLTIAAK